MSTRSFRDLVVWQRALQLATVLYKLTRSFPREETYGLVAQLRRAGVSVVSNIAEGYGRRTRGEYRNFLGIARGSTLEIQAQLEIARSLSFASEPEIAMAETLAEETGRMLWAMARNL